MAKIIYSPQQLTAEDKKLFTVFLAGSIEMGVAENWQEELAASLSSPDYDSILLMNPRRTDWDSSWVQSIDNPQFNAQVNWELSHIERASLIVFYFDPNTISPITMLELGLACGLGYDNIVVCCPDGFFRKGNVEIVCKRYSVPLLHTKKDFFFYLQKFLSD